MENIRLKLENAILSAIVCSENAISYVEKYDLNVGLFKFLSNVRIFNKILILGSDCNFLNLSSLLHGEDSVHFQTITSTHHLVFTIPGHINQIRRIDKEEAIKELISRIGKEDPDEIILKIKDIGEDIVTERVTHKAEEVAAGLFERFESASENPGKLQGVTSGIDSLDRFTWGFKPGKVYIMAGRPSMGKSALMMNITRSAAMAGNRVYVQSMEEGADDFVSRMISSFSKVNNENLNKGIISESEWEKIAESIRNIPVDKILINDSTMISSDKICRLIKKEYNKNKIDLVIVDHIQEISENCQSRKEEVSKAASTLRSLAKSLKIPIIIVSQLSRSVESRSDKMPEMRDLKESGDLEAIADVIILLFREGYYNREITSLKQVLNLLVAKNRNGRTGKIDVMIDLETLNIGDVYENYKTRTDYVYGG